MAFDLMKKFRTRPPGNVCVCVHVCSTDQRCKTSQWLFYLYNLTVVFMFLLYYYLNDIYYTFCIFFLHLSLFLFFFKLHFSSYTSLDFQHDVLNSLFSFHPPSFSLFIFDFCIVFPSFLSFQL